MSEGMKRVGARVVLIAFFSLTLFTCGGGGGGGGAAAPTGGTGGADTTAPTVSSTSSANGATGVAVNTTIRAFFSEPMDASTVTATTFTVKAGSTLVPGTVSYSGTTATFTPTDNLAYSTSYTATVTTGVKDLAGNALASNYVWSFTSSSTSALPGDFPVNEKFAAELIAQGIPEDVARFFAAAKMESSSPDNTTCIYLQTFPNGATREMILRVSPNRQYTPTPDEIANTTPGSSPIYAIEYASSVLADNTVRMDLNYFVPTESLPKVLAKKVQTSPLTADGARRLTAVQVAADTSATGGAGIYYGEIGKTGADVGIGSVIDYFAAQGITGAGTLGSVYAAASALSNLAEALDLSQQIKTWLKELDALEECARNPTNELAKKDPNYSAAAVAAVQEARINIKAHGAVRYINKMTETGAGITPVTAVLSIGLKQAFVWNEQTMKDLSEEEMRMARLAVVPCNPCEVQPEGCPDPPIPPPITAPGKWVGTIAYKGNSSCADNYGASTTSDTSWEAKIIFTLDKAKSTPEVMIYHPTGTITFNHHATITFPESSTWWAGSCEYLISPDGGELAVVQDLESGKWQAGGLVVGFGTCTNSGNFPTYTEDSSRQADLPWSPVTPFWTIDGTTTGGTTTCDVESTTWHFARQQ
jgi:hypothetical protein